jgi:hypothetical protein
MKKSILIILALFSLAEAQAFCGFYVAKAGANLFNNRSEVILVRDGNKSVITMSNDFQGSVREFAMVIPVPTVLKREDIRIANQGLFNKFDAYSGPRLVEYYDQNPCVQYERYMALEATSMDVNVKSSRMKKDNDEYNVQIEASYTVGEYDILILSATESDGLKRWLTDNGYAIPAKAEKVLEPYIKNNLKFFVVKVNAELMAMQGFNKLRPLQIEFESEKFMLPIRLGMANSTGEQDMIIYAFTKNGRVESANYRTLQIPSNKNIPTFIKTDGKFDRFYVDLFDKAYKTANRNAVFTEYAWDVTPSWGGVKCDPCVGPPPITTDLKEAGVWWLAQNSASPVFFTRLHVRYSEAQFPEDLFFIETHNKERFQGRYIVTHPASGEMTCDEGKKYVEGLSHRRGVELAELAALTDWNTAKYSRYKRDGSGYFDERENRSVPPIIENKKGPNQGITYMIGAILIFIAINLLYDYRRILYVPVKSKFR